MRVKIIRSAFGGVEYRAASSVLHLGGVGTAGVDRLEFELPEEWADCAVTLHVRQEGGSIPQPLLLDEADSAAVDWHFTAARRGLWMLKASDGAGYTAMTKPAQYLCYETLDQDPTTDAPDQSIYEQFVAAVTRKSQEAAQAAGQAEEAALRAEKAADTAEKSIAEARELGIGEADRLRLLWLLGRAVYTDADAGTVCVELAKSWGLLPVEQVTLDRTSLSLTEGDRVTLTATVSPADAWAKEITWTSSTPEVAKVEQGVVTALTAGSAVIAAEAGGKSAACAVTVAAAAVPVTSVSLSRTSLSLTEGDSVTLTATVLPDDADSRTVTWSVTPSGYATVSGGVVKAVKAGSCTVTATAGGKSASCAVTVAAAVIAVTSVALSRTSLSLTEGNSVTLTATVNPGNATDRTVTWSVTPSGYATVSGGVVKAVKAGSCTVTATAGGKSASCAVTVTAAVIAVTNVALSKASLSLTEGESAALTATVTPSNATDKTVSWTVTPSGYATVSGGVVKAVKAGSCTVTATAGGKSASCSVTVKAAVVYYSVANKLTDVTTNQSVVVIEGGKPYKATLSWKSGYTLDRMTVTMGGKDVTASVWNASSRTVSIGAVSGNVLVEAAAKVVRVTSVTLSQTTARIPVRDTLALTATVLPANALDRTVTWSSSDPTAATVSGGTVTAKAEGTAVITATADGKSASCTVTAVPSVCTELTGARGNTGKWTVKTNSTVDVLFACYPKECRDAASAAVQGVTGDGTWKVLSVSQRTDIDLSSYGYTGAAGYCVYSVRVQAPNQTSGIGTVALTVGTKSTYQVVQIDAW